MYVLYAFLSARFQKYYVQLYYNTSDSSISYDHYVLYLQVKLFLNSTSRDSLKVTRTLNTSPI